MLHSVDDLRLECMTLPLKDWPNSHRGYRIAVLADLHLGGDYSVRRAKRAVQMALDAKPDFVALVGDYVNVWQPGSPRWIGETLEPLLAMNGSVAAVPGNHDYELGVPSLLTPIFDELNIRLLRNEHWRHDDIDWVGVDSAVEGRDRPDLAMQGVEGPAVCLWHEPDLVARLPKGCSLMLSGHAHGGQGKLFRRFKPAKTKLGSLYVEGFFPDTPTPLYVSRGVGTTLFPVRVDVPPEVSLLTLIPG
jgi:uncharacterized protein